MGNRNLTDQSRLYRIIRILIILEIKTDQK